MGMIASYYRISIDLLEKLKSYPEEIDELVFDSEDLQEIELYIDKAWHGIYFLLSGKEGMEETVHSIAGQAILGGHELGEDLGYGPLRYFNPSEVAVINQELKNISVQEIAHRFDLETINKHDIYPMSGDWTMEDKDYLVDYYGQLRNYFQQATKAGEAMLLIIQ